MQTSLQIIPLVNLNYLYFLKNTVINYTPFTSMLKEFLHNYSLQVPDIKNMVIVIHNWLINHFLLTMLATITVLALPPKESCRRRVSLESR